MASLFGHARFIGCDVRVIGRRVRTDNPTLRFRKKFTLKKLPKKALARISGLTLLTSTGSLPKLRNSHFERAPDLL